MLTLQYKQSKAVSLCTCVSIIWLTSQAGLILSLTRSFVDPCSYLIVWLRFSKLCPPSWSNFKYSLESLCFRQASWGREDVVEWGCGRRETVAKWCGGRKMVKCCHWSFLLWPALGQRLQVSFSLLCLLNSRMCHSWGIFFFFSPTSP